MPKPLFAALLTLMLVPGSPSQALEGRSGPWKGSSGYVEVSLQDSAGQWQVLGDLAFNQIATLRSLEFPAALAGKQAKLRLRHYGSDKAQADFLALYAGDQRLEARRLEVDGKDLKKKLQVEDSDVHDFHLRTLTADFTVPKYAKGLRLDMVGRCSQLSEIATTHFDLGDPATTCESGARNFYLKGEEGETLRFRYDHVQPSTGHPEAPILGEFKVQDQRLKGRFHFGPDNDRGFKDWGAVVALDQDGRAREFKVTEQGGGWGKAEWTYGPAAPWQYVAFDYDIPLNQMPSLADGRKELRFYAYGTCASHTNDVFTQAINANGNTVNATATTGQPMSFTVTARSGTGSGYDIIAMSVTARVLDPGGQVAFQQLKVVTFDPCDPSFSNNWERLAVFTFTPACSGAYSIVADSVGSADPNTGNGVLNLPLAVSGGKSCNSDEFVHSGAAAVKLVPGAVKRGGRLCAALESLPVSATLTVYNLAGEVVAKVTQSNQNPCVETAGLAPGVYYLKTVAELADGKKVEGWKRGAVTP